MGQRAQGWAWAAAIAIACIAVSGAAGASSAPTLVVTTIRGASVAQPQSIAATRDGTLWFTNGRTPTLVRRSPSGAVKSFRTPGADPPRAIAVAPDGSVWFSTTGHVDRLAPNGRITSTFVLSTVPIGGLAAAADGSVWFTEGGETVAEITPAGALRVFGVPGAMRGSQGLAAGPDGAMWFTNYLGASISRIAADGSLKTYTDPRIRYPDAITKGPDGALWFTDDAGAVGRITTGGAIKVYGTPETVGHPDAITAGPDGALWITGRGGFVARVTTHGAITRYATPATAFATSIVSASGSLWVTSFTGNALVRLVPGGSAGKGSTLARAAKPGAPSAPRVTMISDSVASAIWFDPSARATLAQGVDLFLDPGQGRQLGGTPPVGGPPTALQLIPQLGSKLGPTVILFLGDNDDYAEAAASVATAHDELIAAGVTHIVWVTLHLSPGHTSYSFMNDAILHQAVADPKHVSVVDWKTYSASHPEWFQPDGVHLAGGGAHALAQLLHGQLERLGIA